MLFRSSCIFVADNLDVVTSVKEDVRSCEVFASVEMSLSGDRYSEEESSDAFAGTTQNVHVNKKEIQLEELVYEPTVETVETCNFQTEQLCMNTWMIHDKLFLKIRGQIT